MSLSDILGDIGLSAGPPPSSSGAGGGETAASVLLREKQRAQREILSSDFVPFVPGGKEPAVATGAATAWGQISASSVEAPKYWNTKSASASALALGSTLSSKQQKEGRGNKSNKVTKAHRENKQKGELYADRMHAKLTKKGKLAPPKGGGVGKKRK
jgi:hypothetical protein